MKDLGISIQPRDVFRSAVSTAAELSRKGHQPEGSFVLRYAIGTVTTPTERSEIDWALSRLRGQGRRAQGFSRLDYLSRHLGALGHRDAALEVTSLNYTLRISKSDVQREGRRAIHEAEQRRGNPFDELRALSDALSAEGSSEGSRIRLALRLARKEPVDFVEVYEDIEPLMPSATASFELVRKVRDLARHFAEIRHYTTAVRLGLLAHRMLERSEQTIGSSAPLYRTPQLPKSVSRDELQRADSLSRSAARQGHYASAVDILDTTLNVDSFTPTTSRKLWTYLNDRVLSQVDQAEEPSIGELLKGLADDATTSAEAGDDELALDGEAPVEHTGRAVSVWLQDDEPPLQVGQRSRLGVKIGVAHPEALSIKPFKEPERQDKPLDLIVAVHGAGWEVEPSWQPTVLPVRGDTKDMFFDVRPLLAGELTIRITIHLARSFSLLDELEVDVQVLTFEEVSA